MTRGRQQFALGMERLGAGTAGTRTDGLSVRLGPGYARAGTPSGRTVRAASPPP